MVLQDYVMDKCVQRMQNVNMEIVNAKTVTMGMAILLVNVRKHLVIKNRW